MDQQNPYQAPASPLEITPKDQDFSQLNRAASGQRMVVVVILLWVTLIFCANRLVPITNPTGVVALGICSVLLLIVDIWGMLRMAAGLGYGFINRIILAVLMVVLMLLPLVNLILMVILSARTSRALKAAGYRVGLLGANPR